MIMSTCLATSGPPPALNRAIEGTAPTRKGQHLTNPTHSQPTPTRTVVSTLAALAGMLLLAMPIAPAKAGISDGNGHPALAAFAGDHERMATPLPPGSIRVAQAGAIRFLRNVPAPNLRVVGKIPLPKAPRGLVRAVRGAARAMPNPKAARSAIDVPGSGPRIGRAIRNAPAPSPRPRLNVNAPPPLKQTSWVSARVPASALPRPSGPRIGAHRGRLARIVRWFKNNKKIIGAEASLAAIGIIPSQVVGEIYKPDGAVPAEKVE